MDLAIVHRPRHVRSLRDIARRFAEILDTVIVVVVSHQGYLADHAVVILEHRHAPTAMLVLLAVFLALYFEYARTLPCTELSVNLVLDLELHMGSGVTPVPVEQTRSATFVVVTWC